ncbi:TetR/AcrR family transcriptional regulator [Paracoccus zeaxanthinifaciens]|uniref:TetR/AcrR family transcriptional regulator n=1 Tax=Paracoccus zeaxanthinifaciens TaxID=187400 RepID=UPI0003B390C4|nr:WHG domain-containing protein [Paracoccus zeaxanthinifaciens]
MDVLNSSKSPLGLHERAIEAALDLLDNMQSITPGISDVAETLDCDEARLRNLFGSDNGLLIAAVEQALILLIDACTKSTVRVDPNDPVAQFTAIGDAYLAWADAHRAQFRLMSDERLMAVLKEPRLRRYLDALAELMKRLLKRARDNGQLHPKEDIDMMVLSSRCFAYGMARMIVDGRMQEWAPGHDPLDIAKALTRDFVRRMARSSVPQSV